jgi:hypothetical protein
MKKSLLSSIFLVAAYVGAIPQATAFNVNERITPVTATNYPSASTMLGISYNELSRLNLLAGQSAKLQMVVPPGASIVSLRIESNQWIEGPVMATFKGEVPMPCPVVVGPNAFQCGEVLLQPAPGGFSNIIFRDTSLAEPTYMYFVIQATGNYFHFGSIITSIQITDTVAYKAWVDSGRPLPGGGSSWTTCPDGTMVPTGSNCPAIVVPPSTGFESCPDGTLVPVGTPCPTPVTPPPMPVCDALATHITPYVGTDMSVNIDGLTTSIPDFAVLKVKMRYEGTQGSKLMFSVDMGTPNDFQVLCASPSK